MNLYSEELITILEFYTKLVYGYEFSFKDLKIQYKDYIKNISYINCVEGMSELIPAYSDFEVKFYYDDFSVLIIIDNPEIYALLSLYML